MVEAKHLHHVLDHSGGQPLHVFRLPRAVGKAAPGDQRLSQDPSTAAPISGQARLTTDP